MIRYWPGIPAISIPRRGSPVRLERVLARYTPSTAGSRDGRLRRATLTLRAASRRSYGEGKAHVTATPAEGEGARFPGLSDEESTLLASLRAGDEAAFMTLVERYHNALIRLALIYVPSREVAEEVAQETWLGVLQGIERFEGRSSIKTWIFRILTNRAQTRGKREARTLPFSAVFEAGEDREAAVDSGRFHRFKWGQRDTWSQPPEEWQESPEELALEGDPRGHHG